MAWEQDPCYAFPRTLSKFSPVPKVVQVQVCGFEVVSAPTWVKPLHPSHLGKIVPCLPNRDWMWGGAGYDDAKNTEGVLHFNQSTASWVLHITQVWSSRIFGEPTCSTAFMLVGRRAIRSFIFCPAGWERCFKTLLIVFRPKGFVGCQLPQVVWRVNVSLSSGQSWETKHKTTSTTLQNLYRVWLSPLSALSKCHSY